MGRDRDHRLQVLRLWGYEVSNTRPLSLGSPREPAFAHGGFPLSALIPTSLPATGHAEGDPTGPYAASQQEQERFERVGNTHLLRPQNVVAHRLDEVCQTVGGSSGTWMREQNPSDVINGDAASLPLTQGASK